MSFELLHFYEADKILKKKKMEKHLLTTLEYMDDALFGTLHRGELLRQTLEEMHWRKEPLNILDGRRDFYKGLSNGIAIDGSLNVYEFILEGLLRLQIGFARQRVDAGVLLLNGRRSDKTPFGSTRELVQKEMEQLSPVINLPVSIVLFDLGQPGILVDENETETPSEQLDETDPEIITDIRANSPDQKTRPKAKRRQPNARSRKEVEETCPA